MKYVTMKTIAEDVAKKMPNSPVYKYEIAEIVGKTLEAMADRIASGDPVILQKLGSFHVRLRKGYRGVVPGTRQPIDVPPRTRVRFRESKLLKEKLPATPHKDDGFQK